MSIRPCPVVAQALVALLLSAGPVRAAGDVVAWWKCDTADSSSLVDSVSGARDVVSGNYSLATGAAGKALQCDGSTTAVRRKAQGAPKLGNSFTIEAWVAMPAYPWGWCPIVAQREERRAGYFFGIDARGRVGLHVSVDGKWEECNSEKTLTRFRWAYVAATFDTSAGRTVYIDGEPAGHRVVTGSPTYAPQADVLIGRNPDKEPVMFSAAWGTADQPAHFSFDGLIDEVRIHRRCLSALEIQETFTSIRPPASSDLKPRRLPAGEADALRFGAFYESLRYCPEWDDLWRGSGPDVVVAFPFAPVRLVFWRGTSYIPCWVTEKGNWLTNEFMERGSDRKNRGCLEPMSDKQARYSSVRILESNAARAVVCWRYAPVDVHYETAYVDPETGWGDWCEEYHTIYPDGVAVRKVVMWSSDFTPWHEWCQTIEVLQPGQRPEDVLDRERILSVANMKGEAKTFGWNSGDKSYRAPTIPEANVQITYLRSRFNPFLVLDDRKEKNDAGSTGPSIVRTVGKGWSEHSMFPWWDHWPVTQVPILERQAQAPDRPAHSCTSTQYSAARERTAHSMTKMMLCGVTDKAIESLVPLARSWLRPPSMTINSAGFTADGYDPTQRAYQVTCLRPGRPGKVAMEVKGSEESPIENLAVLVRDWGGASVEVTLDGTSGSGRPACKWVHERRLASTDLIVWLELRSKSPVQITLRPREDRDGP